MVQTDLCQNSKQIIQNQTDAILKKSEFWRLYLQEKRNAIINYPNNKFWFFEWSSLWFGVFSYINWLGCFYYLKRNLLEVDIVSFLKEAWGYPEEVSKAMWRAGRNPIAHVGQPDIYNDLGIMIKGKSVHVNFDINLSLQQLQDSNFKKGFCCCTLPDKNTISITFFYSAIEPLLVLLSEFVVKKVENILKEEDVISLLELNNKIPN